MQITIRRRNVEVPEALRTMTSEKISKLARFLPGMDHAEVCFFEERNPRIANSEMCEVTLSGHGHYVRAKATAADPAAAVDLVVDKLEHQLTKLKGKLAGHPHRHEKYRRSWQAADAFAPQLLSNGDQAGSGPDDDNTAKIVKVKRFAVKSMTPDEAALQMDLLQHDFYLFSNVDSGAPAVIYRRSDGHLGLIDTADR